MRRGLWALLALLALSMAVAGAGVGWFALVHDDAPPAAPVAAIIVLGGGPQTSYPRVDRGVELWRAGVAPVLVMTGRGPAGAVQMAQHARAAGVPGDALAVEPVSSSTLRNALFTAELLGPDALADDYVIVTHRTHLPRGVASFRWAGFGGTLTPVAADPAPAPAALLSDGYFWAETVKWPGNILRASVASAVEALGAPRPDALLR